MPAFIVADGTTKNATSYASVAYADDYLSVYPNYGTTWATLSSNDKERWLMFASRFMDATIKYSGEKAHKDFLLDWPRIGAYDCDGNTYAIDEIPTAIRNVAAEVAFYYVNNPDILPFNGPPDTLGLRSFRVDVLRFEWFAGQTKADEVRMYPYHIKHIIECLGEITFGTGQGIKFKQGCL